MSYTRLEWPIITLGNDHATTRPLCSVARFPAISGHNKPFQLDKWGFTPNLAKVEWLFVAGNGRKSGHRAPQKLSTKQSRSKKYAGADAEVEKACCEAWGVDFDDF